MTVPATGIINGVLNYKIEQVGTHRLGIKLDSGTFSIIGANGRDLSLSNPGYVTLPSKSNPGQLKVYTITSNQSFQDANGTSDIIGNTFGTTASIAWSNTMPMYIYAVPNDDEDTIQFMICRLPNVIQSPVAANIGAPDDAVANSQGAFWSMNNIDETLYESNPCICIGSFRVSKNSSDDWIIAALGNSDGIGLFNERSLFTFPLGQNGAASGTYFLENAGTEPIFDNNSYFYQITKSGYMWLSMVVTNCTTAGVGANSLKILFPLTIRSTTRSLGINITWSDSSAGNARSLLIAEGALTTDGSFMFQQAATALVTNALFGTGDILSAQGWLNLANS